VLEMVRQGLIPGYPLDPTLRRKTGDSCCRSSAPTC
jgi:hypothetical protein